MFFALIQLITPIKSLITRIIIQYERKSTNKVMDRVKNIRLQPIFDLHNAQIFGYEVLSEISTTTDNEAWFHHQSANQLLALYQWQLQQPELLSIKGMLFLNLPFAALQLPEIEKQLAGKPRNTIIEMQDPEILDNECRAGYETAPTIGKTQPGRTLYLASMIIIQTIALHLINSTGISVE